MIEENFQQESQAGEPSAPLDMRAILSSLLDRWWLIAICFGLAGLASVVYLLRAPTIYAATAVLRFEPEQMKVLNIEGVVEEDLRGDDLLKWKLKEIEQLLKSRAILLRVIETNNLAADPRFAPEAAGTPPNPARWVGRLASMIKVDLRTGTRLIGVTVEHPDPALAALIANALVNEIIRSNAESYRAMSNVATSFLAEEAQQLQQKLKACEDQLQTYRDQSLSFEQRQAIITQSLAEMHRKFNEARAHRIKLETEYLPVKQTGTNVEALLLVPLLAVDPNVAALRTMIAQEEIEFVRLKQVYKEKHPIYIQAWMKLEKLREVQANAVLKAVEGLRISFENALATEQALQKELQQLEAQALALNKQSIPYNVLLRDIEQYRVLYDSLVRRMGETTIAGKLDNSRIQIFQLAEKPSRPTRPDKPKVLFTGLFAGLVCGVLLVLGLTMLDDSFRTLSETEKFLRVPVLSTIPRIPVVESGGRQFVMSDKTQLSGAESFRSLRASIGLIDRERQPRSFLFTSSLPGEGKTFCALNFAVSLAQQGLRTLLIDCDLRRPMVERFIVGNGNNGQLGVTDYLRNNQPLRNLIQTTETDHFSFIPAGTTAPNPAELLAAQGLETLIEESLRQFDRVVLDSAPIFGVSDTLLLVGRVDSVCLVVRAQRTSRKAVERSIQILLRAGARFVGVVLNAVSRSRRSGYGDPYYDYGYYPEKPRKPELTA